MFGKFAIAGASVAAASLVLATPALAYDCFNASRSGQGNTSAAAGSGVWWSVPELLAGLAGLSDAQIAQVMPVIAADPRVPANFTVYYNPAHPGELASKMTDANATNGKGIDHSDDYSTPVFDAIFQDVQTALG
jgi:hypothetical protein